MDNNCDYNDNYEKIKKRIEEESKKYKYCYIQGPIGPKGEKGDKGDIGPQGPATIEVGITETVEPLSQAVVTNVGTNTDVILNFKIPKGEQGIEGKVGPQGIQGPKGDKGEQGIQGLKGERGEPGPTTIEIGSTQTVEPDELAAVTNVGTNTDVVLDFKIPKGIKGDKGDIGPRGLPGEIGISQAITIDGTETIEPNELAEVQDDFESNIHHLTFYIPKGEKGEKGEQGIQGPIGPQGPAGTMIVAAYAEKYLDTQQTLQLTKDTETLVPLNNNGPVFNANYRTENAIGIQESAFYQVSYFFSGNSNVDCTLTLVLKSDDTAISSSNINVDFKQNTINNVSNTVIAPLKADEALTLYVKSSEDTSISFKEITNVVLTIVKID